MQAVSAAAGPVRCDGFTGYLLEDENARSLSLQMCRHLRQPVTDRLWQGSCGREMFCGTHNNLGLKPMNQPLQRRLRPLIGNITFTFIMCGSLEMHILMHGPELQSSSRSSREWLREGIRPHCCSGICHFHGRSKSSWNGHEPTSLTTSRRSMRSFGLVELMASLSYEILQGQLDPSEYFWQGQMEKQSVGHETLAQKPVRPFVVGLEKVRVSCTFMCIWLPRGYADVRARASGWRRWISFKVFSPFTNLYFQLSCETDPIHLLRYGVCAGIDSGRCRVYGYVDVTVPTTESVRVRGSRSWSWWWLDLGLWCFFSN